jgi:small subunit ribosomal protein S27Ae
MQIFVHLLDGSQSVVDVSAFSSLEALLAQMGAADCRAVYQGNHISSLGDLSNNANVYLTADLDGGKKKKKKKVFTNKKKNKHIHKRVKLAVYSLYSVDGKGNVTQQRKTCPSCGPGTFMAQHWDRYYCGFCHTTIKMDAETIKKNEEIMKKKRAALEAEKKAKEKEAADKAPAGKGKKDAKKAAAGKKK